MSSPLNVGTRGPSAQDVTYGWLKKHISELSRDGGVFLSESEVAKQAGTSRTPVREALLRLEAEGFLQIVPKKGAFIPPISDSEIEAVMQARALVEDWCIQRIVPADAAFVAALEGLIAEQEAVIDDPAAFIELDRAFHRLLVRQAGNPVLAEFYESLRERQIRMGIRAVASGENRARNVLEEHTAIVRALADGDAGDALAAHLSSTLAVLRLPIRGDHAGEHSVRGLS
ncbi:DNA-binding transcriptional regulator, GntR family [Amycolatopsis pretoriensis]|uniref:DNA-binding transcriptional regulator, GntR family n=1 Tax=Amycolatopsis pretoriensis TaxID=218821 RepID=A0A1H5R284_9PSEU|nr:GntR family transcriptional regulator [Amycolatopsis pretoriensis]SEF32174.1 DNA-binding transcriptional regulator, GntR family [Amycolatopsis pretoriensis]